ncbi:hypothetical protein [Streptomyces sp. NPDC051554]|uniref:hypothetical protein n=1 Tax=Streptomyces sp. NPDC051554 TaxID=3365656 RepID=UPI0037A14471
MKSSDYDTLGEAYAEHSAVSPFNTLHDRPAILDLAGEVAGLRVLDIDCATGLLSRVRPGSRAVRRTARCPRPPRHG